MTRPQRSGLFRDLAMLRSIGYKPSDRLGLETLATDRMITNSFPARARALFFPSQVTLWLPGRRLCQSCERVAIGTATLTACQCYKARLPITSRETG